MREKSKDIFNNKGKPSNNWNSEKEEEKHVITYRANNLVQILNTVLHQTFTMWDSINLCFCYFDHTV